MRLYQILVFVHVLGLIALFLGLGIHLRSGVKLSGSRTIVEVQTWLSVLRSTGRMVHGGLAMLLVSGVAMTGIAWRRPGPWVSVSLVGLLVIWILVIAGARGIRAVTLALSEASTTDGPAPEAVRRLIAKPGSWSAVGAANGFALAIVWLMTNRPGWTESLGITISLGFAGALVGRRVGRWAH